MLTIISGTNRKDSKTLLVAQQTLKKAKSAGIDAHLIDLSSIPTDFISNTQYAPDALPSWLKELQTDLLIPAAHFVFVAPEYNGSIPGFLKLFIDALSVHKLKETLAGKKAALIGVASGRAGNLRGIDHLSAMLHHMGCTVLPGSLPISKIGDVLDADGHLNDDTANLIEKHIRNLVNI